MYRLKREVENEIEVRYTYLKKKRKRCIDIDRKGVRVDGNE